MVVALLPFRYVAFSNSPILYLLNLKLPLKLPTIGPMYFCQVQCSAVQQLATREWLWRMGSSIFRGVDGLVQLLKRIVAVDLELFQSGNLVCTRCMRPPRKVCGTCTKLCLPSCEAWYSPHSAIVVQSSPRRISSTRSTPACPPAPKPYRKGRPM